MTNKENPVEGKENPVEGCVLDKMSKEGKFFNYKCPDNGLTKTGKGSLPAWSALAHYGEKCRQEEEEKKNL